MNKALIVSFVLGLLLPAAAQDRIYWTDGTITEECRVTKFDINQVEFSVRGRSDAKSTDRVSRVDLERARDVYKRGLATQDPGLYTTAARESAKDRDLLMAQFGYHAAAKLYFNAGDDAKAVACLEELRQRVPNSGLLPEYHRMKIGIYLAKGSDGARDATSAASRYRTAATSGGWPQGFVHEAEFFAVLAEDVSGALDAKALQARLRSLLGSVGGSYPDVANKINVQLARSLRDAKDNAAAGKIYEGLLTKDGVDVNTRAAAYLGMGLIKFAEGDPANKEPYREALLYFLRVYLETNDAWESVVAEALYHGHMAAQKWGGADSSYIGGKLRYLLKQDYGDSEWAKRVQ